MSTFSRGTIVGSKDIGVAPGATWIACRGCDKDTCTEAALTSCGYVKCEFTLQILIFKLIKIVYVDSFLKSTVNGHFAQQTPAGWIPIALKSPLYLPTHGVVVKGKPGSARLWQHGMLLISSLFSLLETLVHHAAPPTLPEI